MKTIDTFSFANVHPAWIPIIKTALAAIDQRYLEQLVHTADWLPGSNAIFNAFSMAPDAIQYVLFGESPYPRKASANGYAFYDAAVSELFTEHGLEKRVNRATSLRNFIKMLLLADGLLTKDDLSQDAIAKLNKTTLIRTNQELFQHLLNHGFLLLNASLVLQAKNKQQDAKAWRPFLLHIIQTLTQRSPNITWLLFGNIAKAILPLLEQVGNDQIIVSEHPYNLSFIQKKQILQLFRPLKLLQR